MYYTLLGKEPGELWGVVFGDHDKIVVATEAADTHLTGENTADLRIIKTETESQCEIDSKINELNQKERPCHLTATTIPSANVKQNINSSSTKLKR